MYVSRLMTVPASMLRVDPSISQQSPKSYSQQDLTRIASNVPDVYRKMGEGWQESDFERARQSADPQQRQIGETYHTLWQDPSVSQSLHAHPNGGQLEVDAGNHRIRAAQDAGVPAVPVRVSAPDAQQLDQTEAACEQRLQAEGASQYSQIQRQYDASREMSGHLQADPGWSQQAQQDRGQNRERTP
jgi:hypothetical protein